MVKHVHFVSFFVLLSCSKGDFSSTLSSKNWWKPEAEISFDWVLGKSNSNDSFNTSIVDLDAFETSSETVFKLHTQGKKVIAYLSVGTIENTRSDSHLLPKEIIGNIYPQWPEEKWLDIRKLDKMKPWLSSRLSMIKQKGFDAIEPDNLDAYENNTGFDINLIDTKTFCDYLISLSHSMGLGIGQKNMPELAIEYSSKFDWALIEDAFYQGWSKELKPYIDKNKPVFSVDYTDNVPQEIFETTICPKSKIMKYSTILKNRNLDKWTFFCP